MKTVFFIRHAKSSWKDDSLADIERPLNNRGRRDAPFMAKMLRGRGVKPDRLISSPAERALATAAFFAEAFDYSRRDINVYNQIYEAMPEDVMALVHSLPDEWNTALIFGHNPTLTSLVNRFTEEYIANVPTCGIVEVTADVDRWNRFDERSGHVVSFYYPKQYFS